MKNSILSQHQWVALLVGLFVLSAAMTMPVAAQGNSGGMDIKIRAQNRSTNDTPQLCPGFGPGEKGDRLDLDVSTENDGSAVGTARFQTAAGDVLLMDIDVVKAFFGGLVLQSSATGDAVAIWFGDIDGPSDYSPVHVNVELPRGCGNTVSTFTLGSKDKVSTQIKFGQ